MRQFLASLTFSFKEQLTNKFAFGLLVVFVPIWYWVLGAITPDDPVAFRFRLTDGFLQVNGHDLILITAGLNALTMILGFMFFHSARRSLSFDKRLTRAGLNQLSFMAAKVTSLLVTTGLVALYAVLMLGAFWHFPNNMFEVWLCFWLVSLIYGSLGLLLGVLLNNELVGFFIIIMVSMMDTILQNPIGNPAANKDFIAYFPSYGPTQLGVAGGFTHLFAGSQVLLSFAWFAGFLLIALGVFFMRTRRKVSLAKNG